MRTLTTTLLLLSLACSRTRLTRGEWERMPPAEKVLYVRTLAGAEKVKEAKGGNDRVFPAPAEEYARRIDAAYRQGEQRDVEAVFRDLGEKRR
jgi:hypothetical protein